MHTSSKMEVRPTTSCSEIVQGWLKASTHAPRAADAGSTLPDDAFAPRAERLGLGAKFISHSQAAALGIEERRFSNKLAKAKSAPSRSNTGREAMSKKHNQKRVRVESDDDEEETEGRTGAFRGKGAKKRR